MYTKNDAGLFFDGVRGQVDTDLAVVFLATANGWTLSSEDAVYIDAAQGGADVISSPLTGDDIGRPEIIGALGEIAQDAVVWMNDNVCDADVFFEWIDGDFVLSFDGEGE